MEIREKENDGRETGESHVLFASLSAAELMAYNIIQPANQGLSVSSIKNEHVCSSRRLASGAFP